MSVVKIVGKRLQGKGKGSCRTGQLYEDKILVSLFKSIQKHNHGYLPPSRYLKLIANRCYQKDDSKVCIPDCIIEKEDFVICVEIKLTAKWNQQLKDQIRNYRCVIGLYYQKPVVMAIVTKNLLPNMVKFVDRIDKIYDTAGLGILSNYADCLYFEPKPNVDLRVTENKNILNHIRKN